VKVTRQSNKQAQAQQLIYDIFTNNGIVGVENEDRDKLNLQFDFKDVFSIDRALENEMPEFKDVFYTEDLTRYIGTSITRVVEEALEPELLVVPNLFQNIQYEGPGRTVEIGSMGAIHAAEVPEGAEYEETDFNYGEGYIIQLGIAKHGLKMRVTEEVITDNLFDVFGLWLRMAGRALARHKEEYGIKLLNDMGYTVFDNMDPDGSDSGEAAIKGTTTGRGIDGKANGSMTVSDIFDMWIFGYLRGFNYDTLVMNPLAWKVFMNDPKAREILLANGALTSNRGPAGSGANTGFGVGSFGKLGYKYDPTGNAYPGAGSVPGVDPFSQNLNPLGSTFNIAPRYLPSPLKILVSPFVSYSEADYAVGGATTDDLYVTDIIMADSQNAGVLMTKEGVSMDEWSDPERDMRAMKIKERWGMALLSQGKGVAVARNIAIKDNYVFDNVNSVKLDELDNSDIVTPII